MTSVAAMTAVAAMTVAAMTAAAMTTAALVVTCQSSNDSITQSVIWRRVRNMPIAGRE